MWDVAQTYKWEITHMETAAFSLLFLNIQAKTSAIAFKSVAPSSANLPPRPHSRPSDDVTDSDRVYQIPIKTLIESRTHVSSHATWNLLVSACPLSFPPVFCLFLDCWEHDEEGSCLTEDFLEALTERMGLHYSNEATGMAATLPSFMPSQPAPFSGEYALYSVIAYSVFFYSLSFLFCAVIPFSLPEEIYNWCVHSCTCTSEKYITWKAWGLEMDPCMYPAFRRSGHLGIRTEWACAKIVCWLTA